MKRLYAPWRHNYVTGIDKKNKKTDLSSQKCVFCKRVKNDEPFPLTKLHENLSYRVFDKNVWSGLQLPMNYNFMNRLFC